MKTIAVDIDDVLNDFSATLEKTVFPYEASYGLQPETFTRYLALVKGNAMDESKFLTTQFSDFRFRIHAQCYQLAAARPDGVTFMQWLRENGWRTVICTKRDLRLTGGSTKKWLADHHIPYDYLFMTPNKLVFCRQWQVPYLVDDDVFNILYSGQSGVQVYYPVMDKHAAIVTNIARGFRRFEEIQQWIQE